MCPEAVYSEREYPEKAGFQSSPNSSISLVIHLPLGRESEELRSLPLMLFPPGEGTQVLGMDDDDGSRAPRIYLMPLNHTLKNG